MLVQPALKILQREIPQHLKIIFSNIYPGIFSFLQLKFILKVTLLKNLKNRKPVISLRPRDCSAIFYYVFKVPVALLHYAKRLKSVVIFVEYLSMHPFILRKTLTKERSLASPRDPRCGYFLLWFPQSHYSTSPLLLD